MPDSKIIPDMNQQVCRIQIEKERDITYEKINHYPKRITHGVWIPNGKRKLSGQKINNTSGDN